MESKYLDETHPKLKDKIISQDSFEGTILMKFLRKQIAIIKFRQYFDTFEH
jgi:hypothetical protein